MIGWGPRCSEYTGPYCSASWGEWQGTPEQLAQLLDAQGQLDVKTFRPSSPSVWQAPSPLARPSQDSGLQTGGHADLGAGWQDASVQGLTLWPLNLLYLSLIPSFAGENKPLTKHLTNTSCYTVSQDRGKTGHGRKFIFFDAHSSGQDMAVKSRVCLRADVPMGNTSGEGRKAGGGLILERRSLGRVSLEHSILTPRRRECQSDGYLQEQ